MGHDPTHDRPDYGKIRGGAQYAIEHFEEADELDYAGVDLSVEVESNELTVGAGESCARCGQEISAGSEVRRLHTGAYQHEVCPPQASDESD